MTESSIRFNTKVALTLAENKHWSMGEWARRANVTYRTLRAFLEGDPRLKLVTIEQILKPLGICAADIQKRRDDCPEAEVTK